MATEWFVEVGDQVTGPFTAAQLKAQAATNRLQPDTRIRRGRSGKWYKAKNVKGLLAGIEATKSAKHAANTKSGAPEGPDREQGTFLAPLYSRKRRAIIWGCLIAFILLGRAPIYQQLFFDLTMGLIIGSFPIIEVKKKIIEQTTYVLFYPVHTQKWRLRDYHGVEADAEVRASDQFGCLVYVFFWYAILWRFFDFLMPWLGGSYKLYLKDFADERTLIWQGGNTHDYEANLALLSSVGLRIG